MADQLVPFVFSVPGLTTDPVSALDANFLYVSGKMVSVKDQAYGAKGDGVTDDTVAINKCLAANHWVFFPIGTYIVSAALQMTQQSVIVGQHVDRTIIRRTPTHTQDTMIVGTDPTPTASSCYISGLTFNRPITFNGGHPYIPGTSTSIDNKLVGNQAHLRVNISQNALIYNCAFRDMPFGIVLNGSATTTIRNCSISGSIWDNQTSGLQEGVAEITLTEGSNGACTLISIEDCIIGGGYLSAPRNVTIGSIVATYAENVGALNGINCTGVEGLNITNTYIGGQNSSSIAFAAHSAAICTNIKITNNFFDGARHNCILFDHSDATGAAVMVVISNNCFNGELATSDHIFVQDTLGTPTLFQAVISNNTMMACNLAAIVLRGAIGVMVSNNVVCGYNVRGGNTGDPSGSAGLFVVLGAANSDKVFTTGNIWGGGINNLSGTNNCQWGVNYNGAAPTASGSSSERSAGLGLGGGALVNVAQTYPV